MGITLGPSLDRLHDVLMELQKQQLQQLSAWLTLTEERIQKMETCPLEDDLKSLQKLLEDHKVNLAHISFIPLSNMKKQHLAFSGASVISAEVGHFFSVLCYSAA